MAFKINISDKGKTLKIETDSEALVGKKIGEKIQGKEINPNLTGYELQITGTSDISGFPGIKGHEGPQLRKVLLTRADKGMNDKRKGMRLRKSIRGEEISEKTIQINTKVKREGQKKFQELLSKKEEAPEKEKAEETKPEKEEQPKEEIKEEKQAEKEVPKEETKEEPREEKEEEKDKNKK